MTNFRKLSNGFFLINYSEPLNKHISNLKCFPNPPYITQFRNTNDFFLHVAYCEERACQLFESFDVARGQKRAFCSFDYWELSKMFVTYIKKPMWFYLLTTKDNLMDKVWGKTFFQCETSWTAKDRPIVSIFLIRGQFQWMGTSINTSVIFSNVKR